LLKEDFEDMPVLILAGGARINGIDKSLMEYNGKKIIDHQIRYLKHHDFFNINVATDSRLLEDYIKRNHKNVHVLYEKSLLGSGGAIRQWGPRLGKELLIVHCDVLSGIDLKQLVAFHKENKSAASLVLKTMNPYNQYGVARLEGSRISDFMEKPEKSNSYLCYTGISIFTKSAMEKLAETGRYEFQMNNISHKYGYVFEGFWKTFEKPEDFENKM